MFPSDFKIFEPKIGMMLELKPNDVGSAIFIITDIVEHKHTDGHKERFVFALNQNTMKISKWTAITFSMWFSQNVLTVLHDPSVIETTE